MITNALQHTDFMMSFNHNDIDVIIYWNGGEKCSFEMKLRGEVIANGNDFRPSPIHNIDDDLSMISLLSFLCVRPGDTDPEYFAEHTAAHLEWLKTPACDEIILMISDYEEAAVDGVDFFQATIHHSAPYKVELKDETILEFFDLPTAEKSFHENENAVYLAFCPIDDVIFLEEK